MSQACTSCIQNENVAESPVFEKMPYPNFDRVFSQLFPQKTCFSYVVHGAILTSWPHGLAKVISDCPALQIAPAGLPAVTLRFQRLDNPPLSMRCYQLVSTSVWWTDLKSCCFCFVFCFKKLLYNFKIILIKW